MKNVLVVAVAIACTSAFAETRSAHAKLLAKYEEDDTWKNRSNFYFGARAGVSVPAGADGIAPSIGLEMGVAPDFGLGFGLRVLWMEKTPGVPALNIPQGKFGFGAMADMRFYISTIEPLTLYPSLSVGFVAGPDLQGKNLVLPLLNPGIGAKVKLGDLYASLEFGFAGFTIPFITLGFGYEASRRERRAEAWAREQEELAAERVVTPEVAPAPAAPPAPPPSTPSLP